VKKDIVLITGVSGYIGTHTVKMLLEQKGSLFKVRATVRNK
jgi:uncharacterized protein YbjT (DUF2867 family)